MTNENKINEELERLSDEELDKISGGNGTECPSNKDNSSGNSQAREDQRRLQDFYSEIVFGRYIHPQFIPKT